MAAAFGEQFDLRDKLRIEAVDLGGQRYVAGLYWERLVSFSGHLRTIRIRGADQGFDSAALWRSNAVLQAGYGVASRGAVPGAKSLAIALCLLAGGDALICVKLSDDRYAMVGAHDEAIQAGSDFIGTKDEVRELFESQLEALTTFGHTYKRLIAPSEIHEGAEDLDLLTSLQSNSKQARALRKASPSKDMGLLISLTKATGPATRRGLYLGLAVAGLVVIGGIAFYVDQAHNARLREQAREQAAALVAAAKAKADLDAKAVPPPVKPWSQQTTVTNMVALCSAQMNKLPISVGGWMLDNATCQYGTMNAVYLRKDNATDDDFTVALQKTLGLLPNMSLNGDQAGVSVGFEVPPKSSEELIGFDVATSSLSSHFQAINVAATIAIIPPPAAPQGQPPLPPPLWKTLTWSITNTNVTAINTTNHLSLLFDRFDEPGLRIDSVSVSRLDEPPFLSWSVSGHLYAK